MYSTTLRVDDRILVDCEVEPRLGAAVLVLPRRAGQNDTILKFQPKDVHGESAQSVAAHGLPIDYVWCLIEILLPQVITVCEKHRQAGRHSSETVCSADAPEISPTAHARRSRSGHKWRGGVDVLAGDEVLSAQ